MKLHAGRPHPYFKRSTHPDHASSPHPHRAAQAGAWSVPDLCDAYRWPTKLDGGGVIAIVELGGGFKKSDMAAYFKAINQPMPSIVDVSVDGTTNSPGDDADGEVVLDIQVAAASYYAATGKPAAIRMYWASDIAPAVRAAAKDGCDVCSISWGADEADWGVEAAKDMELAALEATKAGMVIFAASGDNDSSDGGPTPANVDLPAGCPHIIGCGGTTKPRTGAEVVWNDSPGNARGGGTGGYSTFFPMPAWQKGAPVGSKSRMVPDVAAVADPATGYQVYLNGAWEVFGGTSAVAPLYAGLFAACGKKLGFVTDKLWANPGGFDDISQGDNGAYKALIGPDPCTGLGVPAGKWLAAMFASVSPPIPNPDPTPAPAPAPPAITVDQAIAWAQSAIPAHPHGGMTPKAVKAAIARGLRKHWPTP